MPYYHVIIGLKSRPHRGTFEENLLEQDLVNDIVKPYNKNEPFKCGDNIVRKDDISYLKITESEQTLSVSFLTSPKSYFAIHWDAINRMKDVTERFVKTLPQRKKEMIREAMPISKNVFIVHGRDNKPALELARIVEKDLGLNSIILHEKSDRGRTIIEKLEDESLEVGYAFIILTPDDVGNLIEGFNEGKLMYRARQNVVLEFGYFIGLLGRNRVCCLHTGDIELPSDMKGIIYKPFKDSIKECFHDIVKELKAAGYKIKV